MNSGQVTVAMPCSYLAEDGKGTVVSFFVDLGRSYTFLTMRFTEYTGRGNVLMLHFLSIESSQLLTFT